MVITENVINVIKMNYHQITAEALKDTEDYKIADLTDQGVVEYLLQRMKAHKLLLSEMYAETCRLYDLKRDEMDREFIEKYREHRKNLSQRDSEVEAKYEILEYKEEKRNLKCSKDKSKAMIEGLTDIIISLSQARKYNLTEVRYG